LEIRSPHLLPLSVFSAIGITDPIILGKLPPPTEITFAYYFRPSARSLRIALWRANRGPGIVGILTMPAVGILFNIDDLGGSLYGHAAYRTLFAIVGPSRLAGCTLSDGDVGADYYCIAIETDDVRQLADIVRIASVSEALGLNPPSRRLVSGDQVEGLFLVRAAYVTSAGELAQCQTPWVRQAWEEALRPAAPSGTGEGQQMEVAASSTATIEQRAEASTTSLTDEASGLKPSATPATATVEGQAILAAASLDETTLRLHESTTPVASVPQTPSGPQEYVPGQILGGKYSVRAVHKGGMGLVYIVDSLSSLRSGRSLVLALKTFQDRFLWNEEALARFEREAMRWTGLDVHPHIVTALLVERVEGRPYIWLEYVDGESLADRMNRGPVSPGDAIGLALQFVRGMRHAYEKHGLLHRDIKPANCMLTHDGVLKITDFGLSKFRAELVAQVGGATPSSGFPSVPGSTEPGVLVGTPAYVPPEVILDSANVDTRGDIYSFGVMLHEMLTGRPLFRGPSVLQQHLSARPVGPSHINEAVPPDLDDIVLKCLEKDPEQRFADFAGVEVALKPVAIRLLGKLPALPPSSAIGASGKLFLRAFTFMEFGKNAEAVGAWRDLMVLSPHEPEAHNNMGLSLACLGHLEEACTSARRAIELKPDYVEAWANLGGFLGRLGRFQEGAAACERAITINPAWAEAHANRGANLTGLDRFEEAHQCFDRALSEDPKYWTAHVMAAEALAYQRRPPSEVLSRALEALAIQPRDPNALAIAAASLDDLGRDSDADRYLELAEAVDARNPLVTRVATALRRKRA
jgi:tetratricopeptide (TPR) repeat protein